MHTPKAYKMDNMVVYSIAYTLGDFEQNRSRPQTFVSNVEMVGIKQIILVENSILRKIFFFSL